MIIVCVGANCIKIRVDLLFSVNIFLSHKIDKSEKRSKGCSYCVVITFIVSESRDNSVSRTISRFITIALFIYND